MSGNALATILRDLRKLCGLQAGEPTTDAALLERFIAAREETAFAALVQRHGAMVWAVCRRVLPDEHAVEDAFQATFLVLARKAPSIRKGSSLAGWLARVGFRLALAARAQPRTAEPLPKELPDASVREPAQTVAERELRAVLDEEVQRLPEKYRLPVVLCFFESRSHAEAAAELHWPVGTVAGRLARAKELLHARLTRRGLTLPGGALATLLAAESVQAVPSALTAASPRAALLAQRFLTAEFSKRLWTSLAALLLTAVGVLATWAALSLHEDPPPQPAPRQAPVAAQLVALRLPRNRMAHNAPVGCVALSPDGKTAASGSTNVGQLAELKLWDVQTGAELFALKGHTGPIMAVAFSPDGLTLASASAVAGQPGQIKLWDVRTGAHRASFAGHTDGVSSLVFTPDGKTLISGGWDTLVILWDVHTGFEQAAIATRHARKIHQVALSKDGKTLATASADRTIKLWELATLKNTATLKGQTDEVRTVAFSPDGKLLASGSGGPDRPSGPREIKLWDVVSGAERNTLHGHSRWVLSVAFSPDGNTLLSGSSDTTIRLWEAATGKEQAILRGHSSVVSAVACSRDGKMLLSGSGDGTVKLWDMATRLEHGALTGYTDELVALTYAADGKTLALASKNGTIALIDARTGKQLAALAGHTTWVRMLAFSPDGKTLASGDAEGMIKLWDVAGKKERARCQGNKNLLGYLCFSPDGQTLATASEDEHIVYDSKTSAHGKKIRIVWLWETATGKQRLTFRDSTEVRNANDLELQMAFSPDGKALAIWSSTDRYRGQLKLYASATGKEQAAYQEVALPVGPEGSSLSFWSRGELQLWDVQQLREKAQLSWEYNNPPYMIHSADGSTLAVRDRQTIKLLDSQTGKVRLTLPVPLRELGDMAFSPDGKTLATWSGVRSITLWDVATGKERTTLRGLIESGFNVRYHVRFSPDGRTLLAWHGKMLLLWDVSRED